MPTFPRSHDYEEKPNYNMMLETKHSARLSILAVPLCAWITLSTGPSPHCGVSRRPALLREELIWGGPAAPLSVENGMMRPDEVDDSSFRRFRVEPSIASHCRSSKAKVLATGSNGLKELAPQHVVAVILGEIQFCWDEEN